jgi:2-polyprenyl-6-methoxyphenol hydroxylase-like FAD-dependent oxidoreductase
MTDADLARRMRLSDADEWESRLEAMPVMRSMLRDARPCGEVIVRPSESHCLDPATGDHWLAAGDAASTFDPLSSQGILKALRSGIFASYAIGDFLTRDDAAGLERYRSFIREEYASYTATRAKYYREEQRWPESEFWQRRHAASP